jgi:hypothetical protein
MHAAHTSNALWLLLRLEIQFDQVVLVYLTLFSFFSFFFFVHHVFLPQEGERVVEALMYRLL